MKPPKDAYEEELFAKLTALARSEVYRMRAAGEKEPVILVIPPETPEEAAILRELGAAFYETPETHQRLFTVAAAQARELLDRRVSPGLGTKVMGVPVRPEHGFRFIRLLPGMLEIRMVVFEENEPLHVASFWIDLHTRRLLMNTDGDQWTETQIDW